MRQRIKILICLLTLCGSVSGFAQDYDLRYVGATNTMPSFTTNQMLALMVTSNAAEDRNVYFDITVNESEQGLVSSLRSGTFKMPAHAIRTGPGFPGLNGRLKSVFSAQGYERSNQLSFTFPQGQYQICAYLKSLEGNVLGQVCFEIKIKGFQQLHLIYPFDDQIVEEDLPVFSWTPYVQNGSGSISYRIRWVETDAESSTLSFKEELAFLIQENLRTSFLPYSTSYKVFDQSREYLWQVQAHSNGALLAESEIWRFKFDPVRKPVEGNEPFVKLSHRTSNSLYYLHGKDLNVEIDNPYANVDVKYTIASLDHIELLTGDWKANDDFKHGKNHLAIKLDQKISRGVPHKLTVFLPGKELELLFIKI